MEDQEKIFQKIQKQKKLNQKKKLSEQKLQHLANIRVKALEKKKEMKQITEKANKLKEIESLKEMKKIQKEQLAKKYDEMVENSKPKDQPHSGDMPSGREAKPIKKKRIIKKIVYQEASSSDSDEADEVEVVKVKKDI